jgi:hypothetical protein
MDRLDVEVLKENGGSLEDIVTNKKKSSESMDDSEWLQESISIEVTHGILPSDHGFSIGRTHDKKSPINFFGRSYWRKNTLERSIT